MLKPSSTPSAPVRRPSPSPRNRLRARLARAAGLPASVLAAALIAATPAAGAQQIVYDPRNQVQNALQAARQLESLVNEARQLANEARMLAASPYSHAADSSQTLRDVGGLAQSLRGVAADLGALERQFEDLYPEDPSGFAPGQLSAQAAGRTVQARRTAEDLARTAAELERLSRARDLRLSGALDASAAADGQTAAIQSSTQVLAVLAEDLAVMRATLLAQSRLMAEAAARDAAGRAAARETRRRFWAGETTTPSTPGFDPFARARE